MLFSDFDAPTRKLVLFNRIEEDEEEEEESQSLSLHEFGFERCSVHVVVLIVAKGYTHTCLFVSWDFFFFFPFLSNYICKIFF